MTINHETPELSKEMYDRIKLVRRDIGNLLFHFTRKPPGNFVTIEMEGGGTLSMSSSAYSVLVKILHNGRLLGTSK